MVREYLMSLSLQQIRRGRSANVPTAAFTLGLPWTQRDFCAPVALVRLDVTPDQHAALSVDPDVWPIPTDREVALGAAQALALTTVLQRLGFGTKTILATETPAQIVAYVTRAITVRQQSFGLRRQTTAITISDAFDAAKNGQA
jgi:hypothetical protein